MSFYPVVGVDFDDLRLNRPGPAGGDLVARIGHVTAAVGFWDLFFARHTVTVLHIKDIQIISGIVDSRAVSIASLALDPKGGSGGPTILLKGRYGAEDISGTLEMTDHGGNFGMPDHARFKLTIGDFSINGTAAHRFGKGLVLTIGQKENALPQSVQGTVTLGIESHELDLDADLHAGASALKLDLTRKGNRPLTGAIDIPVLNADGIQPLTAFVAAVAAHWPGAPGLQADITLGAASGGMTVLGRGSAKITVANGILTLSDMTGGMDAANIKAMLSKDGTTLHLAAPGLDATVPHDPSVKCLSAKLTTQDSKITIDRAVMGGGASSYKGRGVIDLAGRRAVTLTFTPSPTPSKDCMLQ